MSIRLLGIMAMAVGATALVAGPAFALGTMGTVMDNTVTSVEQVPSLLAGLSYLFGVVLGGMGIAKLYEHVQSPQQVPVWDSLKRFLAGGAFFALPMVIEAAANTLVAQDNIAANVYSGFNSGGATANGLDAMVVRFMGDIWTPVQGILGGFAYLAAIILVMVGISRLLKSAQEGPRGPGGLGTIMTFITAGALFSLDNMLGGWTSSLFGGNQTMTFATLQYTGGMTPDEIGHVHAVISGVIAFVAVLGWISFIRGWFIIRDVAEGSQQASLMAGVTHLFGGALAVNLGGVINVVQETLDLQAYGVNFS
ncbi:MAG: hypothetical protein KKA05_01465 [Alphaproteobacteria bacterium]|nr:hypothetical protein [Alphaproteobacteria bacterium]